jgi:hypothetical protein
LLVGENSKKNGKEGAIKWPGLWLCFLYLQANIGRFMLELMLMFDESRLGNNKLGVMIIP